MGNEDSKNFLYPDHTPRTTIMFNLALNTGSSDCHQGQTRQAVMLQWGVHGNTGKTLF